MNSDKPTSRTRVVLLVALIVVTGGVLRFWRLGAKSPWLDEAATLQIVQRPFLSRHDASGKSEIGLFAAVASKDTHPPLYYALLRLWMHGSDSIVRARALSAVVGTASIALLYALARLCLSRAGALSAAVLLAVSAYHVYFSQEARHYVLATFLVLLSLYLLTRLMKGSQERSWPLWLGLALTNAAALYTFYYTAFAILGQFVIVAHHSRGRGRALAARWCVWQMVPAALMAAYLPVVLERYRIMRDVVRPGAYTFEAGDLWTTASQFGGGFAAELAGEGSGAARTIGACLALGLVLVGAAGLRRRREAALLGIVWLLLPLGVVILFPLKGHVYEPKHIIFAAPALAFLGGLGLDVGRGRWRILLLALLAAVAAWDLVSLVGGEVVGAPWPRGYYDRRVEKENWHDAASRVAQYAREGDVLVLNPSYTEMIFTYCYQPARLGVPCPKLEWRRGEPASHLKKRTWLITTVSNVAVPVSGIEEAFDSYDVAFHEEYHDLVGSIVVKLLVPKPSD